MNFNLFSLKDGDWKQSVLNFRSRVLELDVDLDIDVVFLYLRISWSILLAGKRSIQQEATKSCNNWWKRRYEAGTSDSEVACPSTYCRRLVGHPEGCAAAACWHFFRG
jgi:hypothetical protein